MRRGTMPTLRQRCCSALILSIASRGSRPAACIVLGLVNDGLFCGGVAIPFRLQLAVQTRRQRIELRVQLAAGRAIHRMVFAPFLARGVQDAFRAAPVGVFPIHPVEIALQIRADDSALFEIELARGCLGIEILAARFEGDFGGVIETIEQSPVVVIRDRTEVFPCLPQLANSFGLQRRFERLSGELFHVGEKLFAFRMRGDTCANLSVPARVPKAPTNSP